MGKGWVEFEFTPKLLMNLNVGFQNPITKTLNATLKSLNLIFIIEDWMNLGFLSLKHTNYEVKYGFATGLLLHVTTLQTIHKVYQANRTIVTANVTLLNALVLVLQELTFYPFRVFLFFR